MTKMAVFEDEEKGYGKIVRYDKKAYVDIWAALYAILSLILGILYALVALYIIFVINPAGLLDIGWILLAVLSIIGIVLHVYYCVRHGKKAAAKRYEEARMKHDYIEEQYKILDTMYEEKS